MMNLMNILSEAQLNELKTECTEQMTTEMNKTEIDIEKRYRPSNVHSNGESIIIETSDSVPEDVQLALSFGNRFRCSEDYIHLILAQLEQCMDCAIDTNRQNEASFDIGRLLKSYNSTEFGHNKNWLSFINFRTERFFEERQNIFATRSDKGGHTVVLTVDNYKSKLLAHLNTDCYQEIAEIEITNLINKEKELIGEMKSKQKCQYIFGGLGVAFEPDTLLLPRFYGLPKIHKPGSPIRPITSTVGSPGFYLAKIFDHISKKIFPITEFHIRDAREFATQFDEMEIDEGQVLVSFDVVSMFTSIPQELVYMTFDVCT